MPDVPTVSESSLDGYEVATWYGVLLPAGTPTPIAGRIHADVTRAIRLPELPERFMGEGESVVANTPDEFRAFISRELVKWARGAKESGAKVD
jgi:tripartite-type tricarboxylate transporter receptor subunit TctC